MPIRSSQQWNVYTKLDRRAGNQKSLSTSIIIPSASQCLLRNTSHLPLAGAMRLSFFGIWWWVNTFSLRTRSAQSQNFRSMANFLSIACHPPLTQCTNDAPHEEFPLLFSTSSNIITLMNLLSRKNGKKRRPVLVELFFWRNVTDVLTLTFLSR